MEADPPNGDNDGLTVFALRFLPRGDRDLNTALDYVKETCGKEGDDADEYARQWRRGLFRR